MGGMSNACHIHSRIPEGKSLGRPRRRWDNYIRTGLR
jgi:hypothetical protein